MAELQVHLPFIKILTELQKFKENKGLHPKL